MAKHRNEASSIAKSSKMTVMVFQLEGSDETIQEGLRRVSESVQGMVRPSQKLLLASSEQGTNGASHEEPAAAEAGEVESAKQEEALAPERESRGAKYYEKPVKYLSEIEAAFKTASVKIEDFAEEKQTGASAIRRTLVCAMWLRDYANIDEFTADHIYTCFKFQNWTNTPDNPRKFLRNLKSRQACFDLGEKEDHMKLNHRGEKMIEEVLSK